MATVIVQGRRLLVRTTLAERTFGLVHDLDVPLAAIRSASLVTARDGAHGVGVGTAIPGRWHAGSWYSPGRRQLVLLRHDLPGLHLTLHGQRYHDVVVSTPDAPRLVHELNGAVSRSTGGVASPRLVLVSSRQDRDRQVEEER